MKRRLASIAAALALVAAAQVAGAGDAPKTAPAAAVLHVTYYYLPG